jgi:Haem-NO-binding
VKGVIFNLAEQVVSDAFGVDTWDEILEDAGVDGAYTSLGSYPDEDLMAIVAASARRLDVDPMDVVRTIGEGAIPLLVQRYPDFFSPHANTRAFLLTLNDIIHPEVLKLYPGAVVPEFAFEVDGDDVLHIEYRSSRQLCALAEGFITGATRHFGESVVMVQPTCLLRGDDHCVLDCTFGPAPA